VCRFLLLISGGGLSSLRSFKLGVILICLLWEKLQLFTGFWQLDTYIVHSACSPQNWTGTGKTGHSNWFWGCSCPVEGTEPEMTGSVWNWP
jgi:hypothetical protein